ncbi:hypothetical protein MSAN_01152500 [Mycena sanguinolenta]|uniref:Uncharacterized protein n=1 Tax=Mycena sanguinolenta TaxID=230812 RepID=A0A8H6YMT9_9AGAR|nr:hypothetical protein MSAN_01152500 [Mycena sanguinolenta]
MPSIFKGALGAALEEAAKISQLQQPANLYKQLVELRTTLNDLAATVATNHQIATTNHQTALNNHAAVLQQLAILNENMTLQPMRLANATASPTAPLVGPGMTVIDVPHPPNSRRSHLVHSRCMRRVRCCFHRGWIHFKPTPRRSDCDRPSLPACSLPWGHINLMSIRILIPTL